MLNLTELRKHLQANPAFTLTTKVTLELINIAEAAVKHRDSMIVGESYEEGEVLLELIEDVEVGDE